MSFSLSSAEGAVTAPQWDLIPLGEVVEVLDSRRKPITKKDRKSGPYPYYGATGVVDWVDDYLFDEELVLVGEDGAKWGPGEQSAFAISGKAWVNNHAHVLKPDRERITDAWLIYFLNAADLSGFITGLTVPKLNQGRLREIPVPLPSVDEQQRIVAILDQAFAALDTVRGQAEAGYVACRELISAELDAQVEKHFQEASIKAFDDLTSETQIGLVRNKKEQRPNLPYDYIKMQHIGSDGRYLGQIVDRVACSPSELKRYSVVSGDFLFNTRNSRELVGKSCVIQFPLERDTVFNNNIMRVRFRPEVLPEYAAILFRSRIVREQLELMKSGTTSVVAIYHKSLKRLRLPVPSIRDQEALISRIVQVDKVVDVIAENYEKQIADAVVLRQSLLQQAFSGKLT